MNNTILKEKCLKIFGIYWSIKPTTFKRRMKECGVTMQEAKEMHQQGMVKRIVLGHVQCEV